MSFKVGDKVKFIYNNSDKGKIGVVVGTEKSPYDKGGVRYLVFIPTTCSFHSGRTKGNDIYTWRCLPSQIQI